MSERATLELTPIAYTVANAVKVSGLSRATLYRRAAEGALPFRKVGGRTLIKAEDLHRLIDGEAA